MIPNKIGWSGIDADLNESLFEYGLIVSYDLENNEYFCIYQNGENFYPGTIEKKEINNLIEGNEWMDEEDINDFLSFVGMTKNEWVNSSIENKIHDLYQYYGPENIFGTNYGPGYAIEELNNIVN